MKDLEKTLLKLVEEARRLEPTAWEDPGWHDSDFDHRPTKVYDAYARSWEKLAAFVRKLAAPDDWVALFEWTLRANHFFGAVEPYGQFTTWKPRYHSLRDLLLETISRRAEREPAHAAWKDEGVRRMLAAPEWSEDRRWVEPRARLFRRLSKTLPLSIIEGDPAQERARDLLDPTRVFTIVGLKGHVGPRVVSFRLRFRHRLSRQCAISLAVVDRATGYYGGAGLTVELAWNVNRPGMVAYTLEEETRVNLEGKTITLRIARRAWDAAPIANVTALAVWVHSYDFGTFVADVSIPRPEAIS